MKQNQKGVTLVTFLGIVVILGVVVGIFTFVNNMGWTEDRAKENARLFISENNLSTSRMSCAGDSDRDGYGSCSIVTATGENIQLQCPTDFVSVRIFGAKGCKEFAGVNKFIIR